MDNAPVAIHPVYHRIYQLFGKLIDCADGEVHIEYILDITDRKQAEEQRC